MEPNFFTHMPQGPLLNIIDYSKNVGAISLTEKKLATASSKCFERANKRIAMLYPPLKAIVASGNLPKKIFMDCVDLLHDKARVLGCDEAAPSEAQQGVARMNWECEHFETLAMNVQKRMQRVKILEEMLKELESSDIHPETKLFVRGEIEALCQILPRQNELPKMSNDEFHRSMHGKISMCWAPAMQLVKVVDVFIDGYQMFKQMDNLKYFFQMIADYYDKGYTHFASDLEVYKINVTDPLKLPTIPTVANDQSKNDNLYIFLRVFIELQARKYAGDKNIAIDAKWLEDKGTKDAITGKAAFQENYTTKENFIKFLEEARVIGEETSEGPLTKEDIEEYAQYLG